MALGLAISLAITAGACSKSSTTNTASGGSTPGTQAGGSTANSSKACANAKGTLNSSGASFPAGFYEEAITSFTDSNVGPNVKMQPYGAGGSGQGKKDLADSVDGKGKQWVGSDSTVKEEDKANFKGGAFLYFPTVAGPITVSYNLSGVSNLQLSASTIAKIFQGTIKTWNDPAIAADNPGVTLPSTAITPAVRSDGSGTTSNFTKYLAAAAGSDWTLTAGDTVSWPQGTLSGNGNAGVAQKVKDTPGSIGYVDYSDAKATGLSFAAIKNKSGKYVAASLDGASAAVAGAEIKPDLTYNPLNASGDAVYPITAPTYIIVYVNQPAAVGTGVTCWLNYVLNEGQAIAAKADFAKLPDSLQQKAVAQIAQIKVAS